jgi:hypothetical protein
MLDHVQIFQEGMETRASLSLLLGSCSNPTPMNDLRSNRSFSPSIHTIYSAPSPASSDSSGSSGLHNQYRNPLGRKASVGGIPQHLKYTPPGTPQSTLVSNVEHILGEATPSMSESLDQVHLSVSPSSIPPERQSKFLSPFDALSNTTKSVQSFNEFNNLEHSEKAKSFNGLRENGFVLPSVESGETVHGKEIMNGNEPRIPSLEPPGDLDFNLIRNLLQGQGGNTWTGFSQNAELLNLLQGDLGRSSEGKYI